ncbi:hypothetical protein BCR43DRAFT_492230 [Syncephalastrum racemosum]|uniref:Uncharacterized protein n=1 Tax=Syncephalastrum racemosum TaxID=13706 RepID=A0A1X2HD77_SYNRA|nr:hypothetical protein BCR43DRAFT_492230 [Syncephalastrum racemosum]
MINIGATFMMLHLYFIGFCHFGLGTDKKHKGGLAHLDVSMSRVHVGGFCVLSGDRQCMTPDAALSRSSIRYMNGFSF